MRENELNHIITLGETLGIKGPIGDVENEESYTCIRCGDQTPNSRLVGDEIYSVCEHCE